MEQRELIKEIPSGKFHSALFTTYSINLYYWEEQFIRALSGKGINYVSALVDSSALSEQLFRFAQGFRGNRPFDFSIHGVKSNGAFHPKIQFYVGNTCVLVLVGSGNLTVTGHGKNLEVWTPVMVDSAESPLFPLVRDVWHYLQGLYKSLGKEAEYIVNTVESNCELLKVEYHNNGTSECRIGEESVKFFTNDIKPLFSQCVDWIGDDRIRSITVMSPYYDGRAELVNAMFEYFEPDEFRVIYEDGFGTRPPKRCLFDRITTYKWSQILKDSNISEKDMQHFFHSKCFFFEGKNNNYVLAGSANASVAAFGLVNAPAVNHEAMIGMKSATKDYFRMTGFILKNKCDIEDTASVYNTDTLSDATPEHVWIKEAYCYYSNYCITLECRKMVGNVTINFYSGKRRLVHSQKVLIDIDTNTVKGSVLGDGIPLYVEMVNNEGNVISNRQFVIAAEMVETNNPSRESIYYRKKYYEIEAGKFVNGEMMQFFDRIINDTARKIQTKEFVHSVEERQCEVHHFSSIEDFLRDDGTGITGDRKQNSVERSRMQSTQFFDSIIAYISKSAESKQNELIDSEELEDVRTSEGEEIPAVKKEVKSQKTADSVKRRIIKMFDKYIGRLESEVFSNKQPSGDVSLMNMLKQFMAAEFFILRTFSYRFTYEGQETAEQTLIELKKNSFVHETATEYFYRIVSLFSIYLMRSTFHEEEDFVLKQKLDSYMRYAFELGIAIFSICDWINEGDSTYLSWSKMYKEASMMNLRKALGGILDDNSVNDVYNRLDRAILEMDGFDRSMMEQYIHNNLSILHNEDSILYPNGSVCLTEQFGYVYLEPFKPGITAIPCTIAAGYNKNKKCNCPDYLFVYNLNRLLPIRPNKRR